MKYTGWCDNDVNLQGYLAGERRVGEGGAERVGHDVVRLDVGPRRQRT